MTDTAKIRILIVDDEPLVRKKIRGVLPLDMDVEVVGECGNGQAALAAVAVKRPDIIFSMCKCRSSTVCQSPACQG
jgi:DNA-binding NarL/FixJ family response regulator